MTAYVVLRSLGPHEPGDVISISKKEQDAGVDLARLLLRKTIREATEEEAVRSVVVGTQAHYASPLFPVVPDAFARLHAEPVVPKEGEPHIEADIVPVATGPGEEAPKPPAKSTRSRPSKAATAKG